MSAAPGTPAAPRRHLSTPALALMCGLAVLAASTFVFVTLHGRSASHPSASIRVSGLPPSLPTATADLMAASPVPNTPAADFALTDQRSATITMSGLKGKVVVVEFFDPHCTDVCPIVSQELVDANNDLGPSRSDVVFVAVNVNQFHLGVADVQVFSAEHSLNSIPSWHFLTGSLAALQAAWQAYGVDVRAPSPTADIQHSDYVYFIDRQGRMRYMADPSVDHRADGASYLPGGQLAAWGSGIAILARSLVG